MSQGDEMKDRTPPLTSVDAAPRRGPGWVFVGGESLRAGWSLLLFVVIVIVLAIVATAAVTALLHPTRPAAHAQGTAWGTFGMDSIGFLVFVVAAWIMSLIERRPFVSYGLRREHAVRDLLHGMGWGVAMLSVLVGLLYATGTLVFDGFALRGLPALEYALAWLAAFGTVGLFEEYFTRGYLQYTLARGVAGLVDSVAPNGRHARTIGFWVAAAVFSVGIFAAGHLANKGETAMGIVSVALAGITFVYVLYRTGSLWWAIGFHATWDWAQSYLYGVRDSGLAVQGHLLNAHPAGATLLSGGDTGPEGSILIVPVLLGTILIIHHTLPRRPTAFDFAQR